MIRKRIISAIRICSITSVRNDTTRSLRISGERSIFSKTISNTLHSRENRLNVSSRYRLTLATKSFEHRRGSSSDDAAEKPLNGDTFRAGQMDSLKRSSSLTIFLAWYKQRVNSMDVRSDSMSVEVVERPSGLCRIGVVLRSGCRIAPRGLLAGMTGQFMELDIGEEVLLVACSASGCIFLYRRFAKLKDH